MIIQRLKQTLLATVFMLSGGLAFAADSDMICANTSNIKDTTHIISQDRVATTYFKDKNRKINLDKTGDVFGFLWSAKENSSDVNWVLQLDLRTSTVVNIKLRHIRYDDNVYIYVNEEQVYSRVGGGTKRFDANIDISQFFKVGLINTIRVHLINDIPKEAAIEVDFEYTEGGCVRSDYLDYLNPPPPPPIDYTVPVCSSGIDGDACIEKLNTFCAEPENTPYTDCIEWKKVQNEVQAGANNSGTSSGTGGAGVGAGGGIMGNMGNISTASNLMFSPSAFAAQQAIGMIQQFFTCKSAMSEEEKALPNRLNARLCIYVGEYCSKEVKILGATLCRTKKKTYCCFNSTLARIINSEGNKQLGRGMGNPENATCYGFTIDEFNRLDLSRMDLSEFVAEVTKKVNSTATKDGGYWAERNEVRVQNTLNTTNTEDLQFKLLTADDPYSVLNQPTDGKAKVNATTRIVADETEANTPTAKETGISNVTQADKNQAQNNFLNHSLGE